MKKKLLFILIISILLFSLCSCFGNTEKIKITFDSNGGSSVKSIIANGNEKITLPESPTKEGYIFNGWYFDNDVFHMSFGSENLCDNPKTEDFTVYAMWVEDVYTISFNGSGDCGVEEIKVKRNTAEYDKPQDPTKEGYTFLGWFTSGATNSEEYDFQNVIYKDITLFAKWEINQYTITFKTNGGSEIESITENYNTMINEPNEPTKENFVFGAWYIDDKLTEIYEFPTRIGGQNITLFAEWENTITFEENGGNITSDIVERSEKTIKLPEIEKNGYTFLGWYDKNLEIKFSFNTMPSENIILYAKWQINRYTLSFDSKGGNEIADIVQDYDSEITAPEAPEKNGYVFDNWYVDTLNVNKYTFTKMPSHDITLYAGWQSTITFVVNGGEQKEQITKLAFSRCYVPDAHRDGYNFMGWYSDENLGKKYQNEIMPENNTTLYAKWTPGTRVITFDRNGGDGTMLPIECKTEDTISLPENTFSKEGFAFEGWKKGLYTEEIYFDEDYYYIAPMKNQYICFYAQWYTAGLEFSEIQNGEDISYSVNVGSANESSTIIIPNYYNKKSVTEIEENGFANSDMLNIFVPNSIETIGSGAFAGCKNLQEMTLPFVGESIDATNQQGLFGYVFGNEDVENTIEVQQCYGEGLFSDYFIPNSLVAIEIKKDTTISYGAFSNCTFLQDISLFYDTTYIGEKAFYNCSSIEEISIPDTVNYIGKSAFESCTSLKEFSVKYGITVIEDYLFKNCSNLEKVKFYGNINSIGDYAFENCSKLNSGNGGTKTYMIKSTVIKIGEGGFQNCSSLEQIDFENNDIITTIGDNAFKDCSSLKYFDFPVSITEMGYGMLKECRNIKNIRIPFVGKSREALGEEAKFGYIYGGESNNNVPNYLENITILSGEKIEEKAFVGCTNIKRITLPDTLTIIEKNAFSNCISLQIMEVPTSVTSIGSGAFYCCNWLTSLVLPFVGESKDATGKNALFGYIFGEYNYQPNRTVSQYYNNYQEAVKFFMPEYMTSVNILGGTIKEGAFANFKNITRIYLGGDVISIEAKAFYNCDGIASIIIPSSVTYIGDNAFISSGITTIHIQRDILGELTALGNNVFGYDTELTTIYVPNDCIDEYKGMENWIDYQEIISGQ